jgi:hypothetical protein
MGCKVLIVLHHQLNFTTAFYVISNYAYNPWALPLTNFKSSFASKFYKL